MKIVSIETFLYLLACSSNVSLNPGRINEELNDNEWMNGIDPKNWPQVFVLYLG